MKNFPENGKDSLRVQKSYSGIHEYTFLLFLYEPVKIKSMQLSNLKATLSDFRLFLEDS